MKRNEMKSALPCVSRSFFFTFVLKFNKPVLKENENVELKRDEKFSSHALRSEGTFDVTHQLSVHVNHEKVVGETSLEILKSTDEFKLKFWQNKN